MAQPEPVAPPAAQQGQPYQPPVYGNAADQQPQPYQQPQYQQAQFQQPAGQAPTFAAPAQPAVNDSGSIGWGVLGSAQAGGRGPEWGDRAVWEELHHKDPYPFWLD